MKNVEEKSGRETELDAECERKQVKTGISCWLRWRKCCDARGNLHRFHLFSAQPSQTHAYDEVFTAGSKKKQIFSVFQIVFVAHDLSNCICDLVFMGTGVWKLLLTTVLRRWLAYLCLLSSHLITSRWYMVGIAVSWTIDESNGVRTLLTRNSHHPPAAPTSKRSECEKPQELKFTIAANTVTQRMDPNVRVSDDYNTMPMPRTPPNKWNILKTISFTVVYGMMNLTAIIVFWLGHKGVTLLPIGHEVFIYS